VARGTAAAGRPARPSSPLSSILARRPTIGDALRNKLDLVWVVTRNKAKLVAKGYNQEEGTYFDETFPAIARLEAICILLAFLAQRGIKLFQINVKCAFKERLIELFSIKPIGIFS